MTLECVRGMVEMWLCWLWWCRVVWWCAGEVLGVCVGDMWWCGSVVGGGGWWVVGVGWGDVVVRGSGGGWGGGWGGVVGEGLLRGGGGWVAGAVEGQLR